MKKLSLEEFSKLLVNQPTGVLTNFSFNEDGTGCWGAGKIMLFDGLIFALDYWGGGYIQSICLEYDDGLEEIEIFKVLKSACEFDDSEDYVYIDEEDTEYQYLCKVVYTQ